MFFPLLYLPDFAENSTIYAVFVIMSCIYCVVLGESETLTHLVGCGRESVWLIFPNKMLPYRSKANLGVKIFFSKITHLLDPETRREPVKDWYGSQNPNFDSGP